jgi:alpha-methylacyl-CoA racemase
VPHAPHEKGAHTAEVLAELGYDAETLARLRHFAVIA